MTIKVGDTVSWGNAKNPNALAFTGCKVLERARCEEQGHDWENGASFMPLRVFQVCRWCAERRY